MSPAPRAAALLAALARAASLGLSAHPISLKARAPQDLATAAMAACNALMADPLAVPDSSSRVEDCQQLRYGNASDSGAGRNNSRLRFVHVGKAAGGTILNWFWSNDIRFKEIHAHKAQQCEKDMKFVISVRDPIDRAMASFNWRSPRNGLFPHGTKRFSTREKQVYGCFRTFNNLSEALGDNNTCGDLARGVFSDPVTGSHMSMGASWYLSKQLDCVLAQKPHLVRTESIDADLQSLAAWLNVTKPDMHLMHDKGQYPMRPQKYLSAKARELLSQQLKEEYAVMEKLERAARNPKGSQVEAPRPRASRWLWR